MKFISQATFITIFCLLCLSSLTQVFSQNTQLYNPDGVLEAYITPEQELFLIDEPEMLAYLFWNSTTAEYWVYSLEGWHLGYFENGILFNKNYQGVLVSENALSQKISQITYKGIKSILYDLEIHSWVSIDEFLFENR